MVNGCEAGAAGGREGTCWHAGMLRSRVGRRLPSPPFETEGG